MPARRLLYLDATRLTAYRWLAGHLRQEGEFTPNPAGLEAFTEYVAQKHGSTFSLLADIAEEGFQVEQAPFVRGGDRAALIERKLAQYFFGTPYSLALSLGRSQDGRRDERLLLAALTQPAHLEPWVTALRDAEEKLAGIYSLPLVSGALPAALGVDEPSFLLIAITSAGVRQTLFNNGRVIFSRLTALITGSIEEMAVTSATESQKMYQYISNQRLVARGNKVSTLVLVHPGQMNAFREICTDTDTLNFEFVDLLGLAGKLGLHTPPQDSRSEVLFLHLMARQAPKEQFAPEADRHFHRLGQIGFGLRASGYTILGACLLFAAHKAIDYHEITEKNANTATQNANDQRRYQMILDGLPKIPLTNDALRGLIGRYDRLVRHGVGPEPLYVVISQALQESPQVDLVKLAWSMGPGKGGEGAALPAAAPAPGGGMPAPTLETAEIHAQLPLGLAGDFRIQIASVEKFAEQLRARGLRVEILSMPFEAESTKALKSSDDELSRPQVPRFSLRATRSMP